MFFKKSGSSIFGVQFNKKEQAAIDKEINAQIVAHDKAFEIDKEATILWVLHEEFGFGEKRLKRAFDLFYAASIQLWKYYELPPEDAGWVARKKLLENGIDVEKWFNEGGADNEQGL